MAYVITQLCSKEATCVDVCPVDCIHPTPYEAEYATAQNLFINLTECIDCGACETACPVTAIYHQSSVPRQFRQAPAINAWYYR
jgi:formate hydrogenlyase subunit 6/NADH:ubiquinone oxidoreductase subunit I